MTRAPNGAQDEGPTHAKSAWSEYLSERSTLAEKTEKLRALRLAASVAKPAPKG
jgi:hypothetical protein